MEHLRNQFLGMEQLQDILRSARQQATTIRARVTSRGSAGVVRRAAKPAPSRRAVVPLPCQLRHPQLPWVVLVLAPAAATSARQRSARTSRASWLTIEILARVFLSSTVLHIFFFEESQKSMVPGLSTVYSLHAGAGLVVRACVYTVAEFSARE